MTGRHKFFGAMDSRSQRLRGREEIDTYEEACFSGSQRQGRTIATGISAFTCDPLCRRRADILWHTNAELELLRTHLESGLRQYCSFRRWAPDGSSSAISTTR